MPVVNSKSVICLFLTPSLSLYFAFIILTLSHSHSPTLFCLTPVIHSHPPFLSFSAPAPQRRVCASLSKQTSFLCFVLRIFSVSLFHLLFVLSAACLPSPVNRG